ncbi:phospholipid carrier-dependent glycosyltransferase [Desulfopila sp. IMCC35006]|nr:phospholipid carrier-dependent glycosyltransferase [Desulfopila sp. IMCC35006]
MASLQHRKRPETMSMNNKILPVFLITLFIILYLVPLAERPLIIPDETRYAEVPREMLATGDWVVPRINGWRYFEKPPMGYWLTALSLSFFGENNFAVRLPQALSTGLTALLIFFLCSRLSKRRDSMLPFLATLVYLSSLGVMGIGTFAVLDSQLSLFLAATLSFFLLATEAPPGSGRERTLLLLAGILAGCSFLTKGFLAFAIPVIVAGPYLMLQGRWRDTLRMLWLPIAGAFAVSLPWAMHIHLREPDFWHYFFWIEHVQRFLSDSAQHKEPFWLYLAALPGMFLPWTLMLPAAAIGLWKKTWSKATEFRLLVFCLCWFIFPFVFFSIAKGKLITYILPCFPPLAIVFAMGVEYLHTNEKIKNYLQQSIAATGLLALLLLAALAGCYFFWPADQVRAFNRIQEWLLLGGGFATIFFGQVAAFRARKILHKIVLFAVSCTFFYIIAQFTLPALTLQRKDPGALLSRHAAGITPQTYILSGEQAARAVCWYLKRQDIYMVARAGELQYGLNFHDNPRKLLSPADAAALITNHPGQVVLIADYQEYAQWQSILPPPVSIDSNGSEGFLLLHY